MVKKKNKCDGKCVCLNWTGKDWLWVVVSEAALYFFFVCTLQWLNVTVDPWLKSLILLVLINVMFFACPVFRKHFM